MLPCMRLAMGMGVHGDGIVIVSETVIKSFSPVLK